MENTIISVTETINIIDKKLIFTENFKIKGEISDYTKKGRHIYASIKDKDGSINLISWNNPNDFSNGDEVIVTGKIIFYKKNTRININAISIEKKGLGDLFKKYISLKNNYEKNGYFEQKNKKKYRI